MLAIVGLGMPGAKEHVYLDVNSLVNSITRDPDLVALPECTRTVVMQACYIASGSDYASFFVTFIAEGPGSLAESNYTSFLAFIRLLVCAYYIRYRSAFNTSPADPFAELTTGETAEEKHKVFLTAIQRAIWPRATSEENYIPGLSAHSIGRESAG